MTYHPTWNNWQRNAEHSPKNTQKRNMQSLEHVYIARKVKRGQEETFNLFHL